MQRGESTASVPASPVVVGSRPNTAARFTRLQAVHVRDSLSRGFWSICIDSEVSDVGTAAYRAAAADHS